MFILNFFLKLIIVCLLTTSITFAIPPGGENNAEKINYEKQEDIQEYIDEDKGADTIVTVVQQAFNWDISQKELLELFITSVYDYLSAEYGYRHKYEVYLNEKNDLEEDPNYWYKAKTQGNKKTIDDWMNQIGEFQRNISQIESRSLAETIDQEGLDMLRILIYWSINGAYPAFYLKITEEKIAINPQLTNLLTLIRKKKAKIATPSAICPTLKGAGVGFLFGLVFSFATGWLALPLGIGITCGVPPMHCPPETLHEFRSNPLCFEKENLQNLLNETNGTYSGAVNPPEIIKREYRYRSYYEYKCSQKDFVIKEFRLLCQIGKDLYQEGIKNFEVCKKVTIGLPSGYGGVIGVSTLCGGVMGYNRYYSALSNFSEINTEVQSIIKSNKIGITSTLIADFFTLYGIQVDV